MIVPAIHTNTLYRRKACALARSSIAGTNLASSLYLLVQTLKICETRIALYQKAVEVASIQAVYTSANPEML
jgi:benzoyl-CoA reductase/2-hydroxyglutaryl-CoA dehydratase subunit BcrC/BadD/HgdB